MGLEPGSASDWITDWQGICDNSGRHMHGEALRELRLGIDARTSGGAGRAPSIAARVDGAESSVCCQPIEERRHKYAQFTDAPRFGSYPRLRYVV